MKRLAVIAVVSGLAVAGCGQSKEEKATSKVCNARADISKQVDTLKGLTLSTASTGQIKSSLQAIKSDLSAIAGAQQDLKGQRKSQVQAANEQFGSQVKGIVTNLGTNFSISQAETQLKSAFDQLKSTYEKTLAPIDCSGK